MQNFCSISLEKLYPILGLFLWSKLSASKKRKNCSNFGATHQIVNIKVNTSRHKILVGSCCFSLMFIQYNSALTMVSFNKISDYTSNTRAMNTIKTL